MNKIIIFKEKIKKISIRKIAQLLYLYIVAAMCILMMPFNVSAQEKIGLKVDKNSVNPGDEITVSIDALGGGKELYAYTARFSYDEEVFEKIDTDDFFSQGDWSDITYNPENNRFALVRKSLEDNDSFGNLTLKLKVKDGAKAGTTAISLNSITASDGKEDITPDGASAEIEVLRDGLAEDESIPSGKADAAGDEDMSISVEKRSVIPFALLITIIVLIAAFVILCNIRKMGSKKSRLIITAAGIILAVILAVFAAKSFQGKDADVDNNSVVDYIDTQNIVDYILDIQDPDTDEDIADKDLNNDGKITASDIAQSIEEAGEQDYEVSVAENGGSGDEKSEDAGKKASGKKNTGDSIKKSNKKQDADVPDDKAPAAKDDYVSDIKDSSDSYNYTSEKGGDIVLDLNITVTPSAGVVSVIADGQIYPAVHVEGSHYRVTVKAPDKAGKNEITVTGVILDNGKQVNTSYKVTVDVLKQQPALSSLNIDTAGTIPEISFDVTDPDGAFKSGKIVITDENGNVIYESGKVVSGANKFTPDNLLKDKDYVVKVTVEYDRDSDIYGNAADNGGTVEVSGQLRVNADYGFEGKNWGITEKVTSQKQPVVTFENGYDSYYDVQYVIISGKKYEATKENGIYSVQIDKGQKGTNTVEIEKIILANGSEYNTAASLTYIYLKDVPVPSGNIVTEMTGSKLKVTPDIHDNDSVIKSVKVYLTDEAGNTVDVKELPAGTDSVEFDVNPAGSYKVKIEYVYDCGDNTDITETAQYDNVITRPKEAAVAECMIVNSTGTEVYYVQKGEEIKAIYRINTNTDEDVSFITVNSVRLPAVKESSGMYSVSFKAPVDAGKITLEVSRLEFADGDVITTSGSADVEVLKSIKPEIDGISVIKTDKTPVLSFTVKDDEDTFVSGTVTITDESGNKVWDTAFDSPKNTVFELDENNIEDFVRYSVKVDIVYDLDSDRAESANRDNTVSTEEFELVGDFGFDLKDFRVDGVDAADSEIILKFESTLTENAKDTYHVEQVKINDEIYDVAGKDGDTYTVRVPYTDTGRTELVLTEAVLNNKQGFLTNEKVIAFKTAPNAEVHNTVLREAPENWLRNITAAVKIYDPDMTIHTGELHARLLDPENKEIAKQDRIIDETILHEKETVLDFESAQPYRAGTYTVEVYADYDRADGAVYDDVTIGTAKVTVLKYADIENAQAAPYVEKGEHFDITYKINSNTDEEVIGIIVNEDTYEPVKVAADTYRINVTAPDKAGIAEYNATRLIYSDSQISAVNTVKTDVLKSIRPEVYGLYVDNGNVSSPEVHFSVHDEEDAYVSSTVTITDEAGIETSYPVNDKEDAKVVLKDIEKFKQYKIKVDVTYDLDSDKKDTKNQKTEMLVESAYEAGEYEITAYDYKLYGIDTEKKVIKVSFTSTNNSGKYYVKSAMINDVEYSVAKRDGNDYIVEIPYEEPKRQELTLQGVILENLERFADIDEEPVTVFKEKPEAAVEVSITDDMKEIRASVGITDNEMLITSLSAVLSDKEGVVLETKPLQVKQLKNYSEDIVFTGKGDAVFEEGDYTVSVVADYDAANGEPDGEKTLTEENVSASITAKVVNAAVTEYYVAKGGQIEITYTIEDNTKKDIQDFMINNEVIVPVKLSDGVYKVSLYAPDSKYGPYECSLTDIVYAGSISVQAENTVKTEVLKSAKPVVDNLAVNDLGEKPKLSFTITDEEDTFVSGKIVITDEDGQKVQEIKIDSIDELSFELDDIEQFVTYRVQIYVTYDFDSDKEDAANRVTEELLKEHGFEIGKEFDFRLDNLNVKEVTDTEIVLEFESSLTDEAEDTHYLDMLIINGQSYKVKKQGGDMYTVSIPYTDRVRTVLTVEKAILNSLHEFTDIGKQIVVFKSLTATVIPTASLDAGSISADINITDEDNIAGDIFVVLKNEKGELERKRITGSGETKVVFENEGKYDAGQYTVEVLASYDAEDGLVHENEVLASAQTDVAVLAEIKESIAPKYAEKGEETEITYVLMTNAVTDATTIVINNIPYEAVRSAEDTYKVKVKMPDTFGVTNLDVSRINFGEEVTRDVLYTSQIEVLKSVVPEISNVTIDDTKDIPVLGFTVNDTEDTFISGRVIVTDPSDKKTVKEISFDSVENTSFNLDGIKELTVYDVDIEVTYDFDLDKKDGKHQTTAVLAEKSFEIIKNYDFTLTDLKVKSIDRENKKAVLEFVSTNIADDRGYIVDTVTINGEIFNAEKRDGDIYTVEVPYETETRKELVLESATLNNLKEFKDFKENVVIFKAAPRITADVEVSEDLKTITAHITMTDDDSALTDLNAMLINPKGELLTTKDIDNDETTVMFASPEGGIFKAGEYTVEFGADYECADGQTHNSKEIIGSGKVKVATRASITEAEVQNYYVDRNGDVEIKYTVLSNNDNAFSGINIENGYYPATAGEDGTYTVMVPVISMNYGRNTISVSNVMFGDESVTLDSTSDALFYVLKAAPSIDNYSFNDNEVKQTVTFDFNNKEEAIVKDARFIIKQDGKERLSREIQEGSNKVELDELENGDYTVTVSGTYDLDDTYDEQNSHALSDIFGEQQIHITSEYELRLNIENVTVDRAQKRAMITFTSTNAAAHNIKYVIADGERYEVTKLIEADTYMVKIGYDKEEYRRISISGIVTDNGVQLNLPAAKACEIFVAAPTVSDMQAYVDRNNVNVKFNIIDDAGIMKNAEAVLKDADCNAACEPVPVYKDTKEVNFNNIGKAGKYSVEIVADFNRVDGEIHEQERINKDDITVQIGIMANVTAFKASKYYAAKNEEVPVTYTVYDNTDSIITGLVINDGTDDKEYRVTTDGNDYTVMITAPDSIGEKTYTVTKVKYGDAEVTAEGDNRSAAIYVIKDAPVIKDYTLDDTKEPPVITFNVENPDRAAINAKALVKDEDGTALITADVSDGVNTIALSQLRAGRIYSLVLSGTYNLDDKDDGNNEYDISELFSKQEFQIGAELGIKDAYIPKRYVEKGETATIIYDIESNTDIPVSYAVINGQKYNLTLMEDGRYSAEYKAKDESGVEELKVTALAYGQNELSVTRTDKIEVLKQKPELADDYQAESNYKEKTITFKFKVNDPDNAVKGKEAYVSLLNIDADTSSEKVKVTCGKEETVTFGMVNTGTNYQILVSADYDRDTDELNVFGGENENLFTDEPLFTADAQLLKERLSVSGFVVKTNGEKPEAFFTMTDDDNSFISGNVVVIEKASGKETKIPVQKGVSSYPLELKPFEKYTVRLEIEYDLDDDPDNSMNRYEEIFGTEDMEYIPDYELTLSDYVVNSVDKTAGKAVLQFVSANASEYGVKAVTAEGGIYSVQKAEDAKDTYTFEYNISPEQSGKRIEITITEVTLENDAKLKLDTPVTVVIFRDKPQVTSITTEPVNDNAVNVKLDVTDTDNALTRLYAVLKDEEGNIISSQETEASVRELVFENISAGNYKVEIFGDYGLADGETYVRQPMKESGEVRVNPAAAIGMLSVSNRYPKKGETIDIRYSIMSNTGRIVNRIYINDVEYTALMEDVGTYKISYTAPSVCGVDELKVTKIVFDNGEYIEWKENPHTDYVDVLKTEPQIISFSMMDSIENESVMFTFEVSDPDGAVLTGKAVCAGTEQTVSKGSNSLLFKVVPDMEQTIAISVDYDLDSNSLEDTAETDNRHTITYNENFTLLADYGVTIDNVGTYRKETGEKTGYFAKGEAIRLRFNCTNKANLAPVRIKLNDLDDETNEGEWFDVQTALKEDESVDYYYVDINGKNEPGTEKIEILDIKLSSGKVINRSEFVSEAAAADIDILKDKPEIGKVSVVQNESDVTVSFDVTDNDGALLESHIIITDNEDGKEAFRAKVGNGKNTHTVTLTPGKKYRLVIEKNYNLDSLSDDNENVYKETVEDRVIEIATNEEPDFIARNLTVPKRIPNGAKVPVSFENGALSYIDVSSVTIDGVSYDVHKDEDNVYRLELTPKELGVNTIHVESVQMGDKTFKIGRNLSYIHENIVPTAINVDEEIGEDTANNLAVINYTINDPHQALKSLTAYMKNSVGKVVATQDIDISASKLEMPLIKSYRYIIDLKAEYDVGDGKTMDTVTLFTKEKNAEARVNIVSESIDKEYADKDEEVVLTYKINTNFDQDLRKVFIGDISYSVTKVKDQPDTYQMTMKAPKEAGIHLQEVTQMQVGNNNYKVEDPDPVAIKVLRDKPTLTHFVIDEETNKMSFRINDVDKALTEDVLLKIKDDSGNEVVKRLKDGNAEYTFDMKEIGLTQIDKNYNITVNASYDTDPAERKEQKVIDKIIDLFSAEPSADASEEQPEESTAATEDIFIKDIKLSGMKNYNFTFKDGWGYYIFSMNSAKNDMEVTFESTNASPYKPEKVIIDDREYLVEERDDNEYVALHYRPSSYDQPTLRYDKVILSNGAAFDINEEVDILVLREDQKFDITDVEEDIEDQKIRFTYNLEDKDSRVASNLRFTLRNSQNQIIQTREVEVDEKVVEFDIPNPPTAKYKLTVKADLWLFPEYTEKDQTLFDGEFDSKVNTSILESKPATRYPRKGETFEIEYIISSTKVVLVDLNNHENLQKAVNVSTIVINDKEYNVEHIDGEKYRIYYTAGDDDGIEKLNITQINFSNGETEEFYRTDEIEVLKDTPVISDYSTENNLTDNKVKFKFKLSDPDGVLTGNQVYALVGNERQDIEVGDNTIEFNVETDKLLTFEVKADYDLDTDVLNDDSGDANSYTDHTIFSRPFMLTGNYNAEFSDIKTYNTKGKETKYFEKNEDVKVEFGFTAKESLYPESVRISGNEYKLDTDKLTGRYYTTIPGTDKAGEVTAALESVTLNSGNVVALSGVNVSYEILKDIVRVDGIEHSIDTNDADIINLKISVSDADSSFKELRLDIKDEYGHGVELPDGTSLKMGTNNVSFSKTSAEKYFVSVYATYDRDTDNADNINYYDNERISYKVVTINNRYIEMKDIVDVKLFRYGDSGSVEKVDSLTVNNLEVLSNCLVEVTMRDLPSFYSEIASYSVEDGKLKLVLKYSDAMTYDGKGLKPLEVTLDILADSSYEYSGSFKALVEKMRNDPTGSFTLDKDYDLDDYTTNNNDDEAVIDFEFKGTLDGKGHTISNLHKALFRVLRNGTVKNVAFKETSYTKPDSKSVVTKYGYGAKIDNVHIDGVSFIANDTYKNGNATFAYRLESGSVVENSSAVNINFSGHYLSQVNAGGVAYLNDSKVINCYVQGKITSGWHFNGGIVGISDAKSEISNNISNMIMTPYFGFSESGNGGIVSAANGVLLKNNLSLVSGNGNIAMIYSPKSSISANSENNYCLAESNGYKNTDECVSEISKDDINEEFFKKLGFNSDIWELKDASFDSLPKFKGASVAYDDGGFKPKNSGVYIPDYNRICHMEEYDSAKEVIYHNMYKIMPFYDAKEILTDGNKIDKDHILNHKIIKYVLPYDKDGRMVSVLTTKDYDSLSKISVVFEDGTEEEYNIEFDDYYGNVVSYIVTELNTGYNYNKFVVHEDSPIIEELVEEAEKYDFTDDLEAVTPCEESRLYKEYYEDVTRHNLRDFVEKMLVNCGYMPTFESDALDVMIRQDIVESGRLKKMLFAYNYFRYWYDLDMDGIDVADSIMFHGDEMFDGRMVLSKLADELTEGSNSATNGTGGFYSGYMAKYTELSNLGEFLDYYVTCLTDYENGDDWFKANWHGGIYEAVSIDKPDAYYTLWDHLKRSGNTQNSFLPLFNVPGYSMYVITSPTQVFYGSLRIYMRNPEDPEEVEKFRKDYLNTFLQQVKNFYRFAYDYVGPEYLNPFVDQQYDIRTTFTQTGTIYNNPKTTVEPYHKYFAEALNKWPASNGTGAYATGAEVYWNVIKLIPSFNVATHETLHNQDSKIFLKGYGRRGDAEDYTAGNLQQYYNDGWISPNVMVDFEDTAAITQNYTYERIDKDEKLKDFYNKLFELNDFLDYIEAKAFFQLSAEEKAKVAVQVFYPKLANADEEEQKKGDSQVGYEPLTLDKVKSMELKDMEDLWDNQIMLRPGVKATTIHSPGANTDSIYNIHWYQPHADNGRPDGANFKWLAWEMAATGGYYDGYMAYYSQTYIGKHTGKDDLKTTDLVALRYITKDDDITFREYKLKRYDELAKHWNDKGTYIDAQKIYEEYLAALRKDAQAGDRKLTASTEVKRRNYRAIKKATNDLRVSIFSENPDAAD